MGPVNVRLLFSLLSHSLSSLRSIYSSPWCRGLRSMFPSCGEGGSGKALKGI